MLCANAFKKVTYCLSDIVIKIHVKVNSLFLHDFFRFTLMIVDYGKKTNERCNYANIYYSRAHIRRMYGAFCVFLSSEIQGRRILHKTKEKPSSRFCRTPQKDIFRPRSLTNKALFANKTPPAKAGAA